MNIGTLPTKDPADWSDILKPEYSGRLIDGVIRGPIGNADYMRQEHPRGHKDYVMSRSEMKNFAACPARWRAGYRSKDSESKAWGSLVDALLFDVFEERYIVAPETYETVKGKKNPEVVSKPWNLRSDACRAWKEEQERVGRIVISKEEFSEADLASDTLFADNAIADLIDASQVQVLVEGVYEDRETELQIPVKACLDLVPGPPFNHILADLKTTVSVNPDKQDKECSKYWYDAQGALYLDMFEAAGDHRTEFRHILQENFPPYQVGRRFLTPETLGRGRDKYHAAMKLYCQCLKTDKWPSHEEMAHNGRLCVDGWLATQPPFNP